MNIFKSIIALAVLTFILSSCASLRENQAATTDEYLASVVIKQIKETGIVVIFPTEHKKEKALINIVKSKPSMQADIDKLRAQRKERLTLWQNIKKEYSFNQISIVPDSLLKSYIADPNRASIIANNNELQEAKLGDIYVLYTDYGGFEVKRNGQFLPNPFPNKVNAAWGSSIRDFLGVQSEDKSVKRFFTELDKQLNIFYEVTMAQGN